MSSNFEKSKTTEGILKARTLKSQITLCTKNIISGFIIEIIRIGGGKKIARDCLNSNELAVFWDNNNFYCKHIAQKGSEYLR